MGRKSFIGSTIILMLTGIAVKGLGFVYRIYLSNLIGAEGMGLFQLILPVYTAVILTLTAGISIAVSKMTAEEIGKGNRINLKRITRTATAVVTIMGIGVSILMYVGRNYITDVILKDPRTYAPVMVLIPLIPVIAASSAIKGYFYGIQDVVPAATAQLIEQLAKMGFVMALAGYCSKISLELACAVAIGGMAIGEITSFLYVFLKYRVHLSGRQGGKPSTWLSILKRMLIIAVPVSASRMVTSVMHAIEVILIPRRLTAGGLDYQAAMQEYGKLTGMAMPVIYMPAIITAALAVMLVPAISESLSSKSFRAVRHRISRAIQLTLATGYIFTIVFMTYSHEIGSLVYRREKIGDILYMLAFTCVFVYLQQTLMGILNGLGKQGIILRNTTVGSCIRIGFVWFIVPYFGIPGYVLGMVLSLIVVCIIDLCAVVRNTGIPVNIPDWVVKPGIVALVVLPAGRLFYQFYDIFIASSALKTVLAVSSEAGAAALLMLVLGIISRDEILRLMYIRRR